ncbi:MAG: bifunctional diguanylate cyclase/phosphodiesterase [Thermodesulfobacteriota bacterium]
MNPIDLPRSDDGQNPAAAEPRGPGRAHWLGLVFAVAVIAATLAAVVQTRSLHQRALEQNLSTMAAAAFGVLETWAHARLEQVLGWAAHPAVQALASQDAAGPAGPGHADRMTAALGQAPGGVHAWAAIALVSSRRQNLYAWGMGSDGAVNPLADHGDLLRLVFSGRSVMAPFWPRASGDGPAGPRPLIVFAAPVSDGAGRVLAALIMAQDPAAELAGHLRAWRMDQGRHLVVFDHEGRVILDTAAAAAGESASLPPGSPLLTNQPGQGRIGLDLEGHADHRERMVVGAWSHLPEMRLGLAVEMDRAEANAALASLRGMLVFGASLLLGVFFGLWHWLARSQRRGAELAQALAQANRRLNQEVDHCRLAETELTASRERYRQLFDQSGEIIIVAELDPQGRPGVINEVNRAACELLGYQAAELAGRDHRLVLSPLSGAGFDPLPAAGAQAQEGETQLRAKDGELIPVAFNLRAQRLDGQTVALWRMQDIRQRREDQRKLREREARLGVIVDGFEGFIYICSDQFRLEFVNHNLRRHLGRDPVGELCHQVLHGAEKPCAWCSDGTILSGQTVRRETYNPSDRRWYYSVLAPLVHPDGRVSKHGMMLDITDRKRAEQELASQEGLLRSVLGSLPAHIAVLNSQGVIIAVNQAWSAFGHARGGREETMGVGANYLEATQRAAQAGDDLARQALEGIQAVMRRKRDSFSLEYLCPEPGGAERWFLLSVTALERAEGGVVVSHLDVSERVVAQRAVLESQARYRSLVDDLPLAVVLIRNGRVVFANGQALRTFGVDSQDDSILDTPLEFVASGEREGLEALLRERLGQDAGQPVRLEITLRRVNGEEFAAEVHAAALVLQGEPMLQLVVSDITERKQAERTISVLARFPAENPNPVLRVSRQGELLYANPASQRILHAWSRRVGDQVPETWRPALDEAMASGHNQSYEIRVDGRFYAFVLAPVPEGDYLNLYGNDVTERRLYEERLAASEANYRAIFNSVADAIFVHEVNDGSIVDLNQSALDLYGYSLAEARQLDVGSLSAGPPYHGQEQALEKIMRAVAGQPQVFEWLARRKDGSLFWAEVSLKRAFIGGDDRLLAMVRDISQRKQAEEQIQLLAKVFENTIEGITVTDLRGNIQMVNPGFTHITGYSAEEVVGRNPRVLKSDRHDEVFYENMWREITERGHWSGEIWNRRKSGEAYPEWLTINVIKDSQGQTTHYVALFHDITEIKRSEEKIKHQAYHDALTGLPNRQLFNDRLEVALARARRNRTQVAVMFLDLDHFKTINDSLGHAVGDLLLQGVAQRLSEAVRQEDTVSRLGGDEFIMILPDVDDADDAVAVAGRIIESLEKPFTLRGHDLYITSSVGITIFPNDGGDLETLVKNADMAMYLAKEEGRNTFRLFTPAMNERARHRQELLGKLRKALERGEFLVYYQPQVDLGSGRVAGMEALVRWQTQDGRLILPGQFIPLAEETGLIVPIGEWVLEEACRQAAAWVRAGHSHLRLAVNLSARQFNQPGLVEIVGGILERTGLPPGRLELEITESTVMTNLEAAADILRRLHERGVKLALDDFGTGHSSLYYLKHFSIDVLKIDRSFIVDLPEDQDAAAIAEAVVSMARSLGLKVLAEGVETEAQLDFLRALGCDQVQGFIFSRPLPAASFERALEEGLQGYGV